MTELLVSIRSADELAVLPENSVAIVDVKEPAAGSLGPASADQWRLIATQIDDEADLSLALGELSTLDQSIIGQIPNRARFAKIGLAGMADAPWSQSWLELRSALHESRTELVLVVYADSELCQAPSPDLLLQFAIENQCETVLVDTFVKNGQSLFDHWSDDQIKAWVSKLHEHGIVSVLAGSLSQEGIESLQDLNVDYVAVRGAVCDKSRNGDLVPQRVKNLARLLKHDSLAVD
ncbi:MAG: (5-formylfuran-3-yl)methyl phosphate synthase [Pirellulaceae bacterium]